MPGKGLLAIDVKSAGNRIEPRKTEISKELKRYDKSYVCLPRQHLPITNG